MPKPRLLVYASYANKDNLQRPQRGDVISVYDTDTHPGRRVYGNPQWRIIDVDIQVDNPLRAMAWLIAGDDAIVGYQKWYRRQTLNLDKIEKEEEKSLGRSLASDDIIIISLDKITSNAKIKLTLPHPRIIR